MTQLYESCAALRYLPNCLPHICKTQASFVCEPSGTPFTPLMRSRQHLQLWCRRFSSLARSNPATTSPSITVTGVVCNRAFQVPPTPSHQLRYFVRCIRHSFAKETLSLFRRTFSRAGCTRQPFYS